MRTRRQVSAKQKQFLTSAKRFTAFIGGRGSGKTYAGCLKALHLAGRYRCTGGVIAPTYPMLNDIVLPTWLDIADSVIKNHNRSSHTSYLINGSKIVFRSADKPDRLRGPSWSWFWCDEASMLEEYLWLIILATLRESGRTGTGYITTTPRGKNWVYDKFVTNGRYGDFELVQSHTNENPFTNDEYKAMIKREYGVGWFSRQELAGEFCEPEGALFDREWFNCVDPEAVPERFTRVVRGWDLAVSTKNSADYTVGVKLGITDDGNIYILDVQRMRTEWPDSRMRIIQAAQQDGPECMIKIEKVAFQLAALQELLREPALFGYSLSEASSQGRDKLSHALPIASRAKAGKVFLVRAAWNSPYLDELCSFTGDGSGHDDQVDATSIATRAFINVAEPKVTIV